MTKNTESLEFWETTFKDKQMMWGDESSNTTALTVELFKNNGLKKVLIPGFGYGRNGKVFSDNGFNVTGIEISATAIDIAHKQYGDSMKVYHGNVTNMPFDDEIYDGVFCYALLHLLNENERTNLINNSYQQLKSNGYMVFVTLSKHSQTYGEGVEISKNRFASKHGVNLFYYDEATIKAQFSDYGLLEIKEVNEYSQTFWFIICKK
ncbi:class I SAM-dependent methyltransferase [Colwellia sp. E2M01]|uniref:class I SAM-dependent methyltransferase n=1 Tax=Colwellia sp. E2M01 TaxID=2841561 RepID=UPI001C08AE39|nr:class I SAM-dependent methyltransferase [Colwellia sp. E2M01]MBU2872184.1 class I SAM-dependent methyltransferase [Colwellia sp. E2M01]